MTLKSMPSIIIGKLTWYSYQGVSRALVENSRTLRLPTHLHERLGLIKNAKIKLQEKGITPSIDVSWLSLSDKQQLSLHLIFGTLECFTVLSPCLGVIFLFPPLFQRIAECLNMSKKKVKNATEVLHVQNCKLSSTLCFLV